MTFDAGHVVIRHPTTRRDLIYAGILHSLMGKRALSSNPRMGAAAPLLGAEPRCRTSRGSLVAEVLRVEVVDANVAVLAAAGEAAAVGVEHERVDGPEVPADAADLVLVNLVEEDGLELAGAPRRGRHLVGRLPASNHHLRHTESRIPSHTACRISTYVVHERRDRSAVDRAIGLVGLDRLQRYGVIELPKSTDFIREQQKMERWKFRSFLPWLTYPWTL